MILILKLIGVALALVAGYSYHYNDLFLTLVAAGGSVTTFTAAKEWEAP